MQLTAVGAEAVRRAEDVLARTEDLVEAARNAGKPLSGRFRLGVIPTVAPFLLPARLPDIKTAYPNLRLFIREDLTPKLVAALKTGHLDAAVIALPYSAAGIEHARIGDDEILAAAPVGHALAGDGPIPPGSLKAEDLILLEDGHCLRDQALAAFDIEAPKGDDVFAATSLHTLVQMVSSGAGREFPAGDGRARRSGRHARRGGSPHRRQGAAPRDRGRMARWFQPRGGGEAAGRSPAAGLRTLHYESVRCAPDRP